ncbi:MAG: kelch repeat-containing protein, partial [Candidatus Eisenbacteria bacterium]
MNGRPLDRLAALLLAAALTLPVPARSGDYHDGTWTSLDGLPGRSAFAMGYDGPRARFVVYGGRSRTNAPLGDTWAFDPAQNMWTALDPLGSSPGPRYGCLSAMDSLRHRMVMFGGYDGANLRSDVWTLTLGAAARWDSIPISGGPGPRQRGVAVYDPAHDRVIVFGGTDALDDPHADVWELRIGTTSSWTLLAPTGSGPAPTYSHRGIYDPLRDRVLYYVPGDTSQVYALDLTSPPAWHLLATTGVSPTPRFGTVMDYDPTEDRLVVHGGIDNVGTYYDDTWALSLGGTPAWSTLTRIGIGTTGRAFAGGVYDPVGLQLVMIGGLYWNSVTANATSAVYGLSMAPFSTWQSLVATPATHVARESAAAAYDVARHELLLFGGATSATTDVDILDLSGSAVWSHWSFASPPPALSGASGVYDEVRDRMLVFGGQNGGTYSGTVWMLDRTGVPTWSPIVATGGPPAARRDASLVLDQTNDRLIVYGGRDGSGTFADVWALSLGVSPAWTQLSAGAPPGARYGHSAAVDAANSRMLVFGGRASAPTPALGDLWAMALSGSPTWTALAPTGTPPAARDMHTAVVDPTRHRMLVQGGEATGVPLGDLWSLALSGPLTWTVLNPAGAVPPSRYAQAAVWAPDLDAMLVADGHGGGGTLNDAWSLDAYTVA